MTSTPDTNALPAPFATAVAGGVIDLFMGIPATAAEAPRKFDFLRGQLIDRESKEDFAFPVEYIFKEVPKYDEIDDPIELVLAEMDRFGIRTALLGVGSDISMRALREHRDRFLGAFAVDPNAGMDGVRALEAAVKEDGIRAATAFPAGCFPQVPINDKKMYPLYAKCVELDIPIFVCAGVPGPRVPMGVQDVALIDEVCWFFPELKFVTRHGCEPWADLAVKLLLKWPNLYYSTSAFAPKHYPKDIIDYANTRGADKVMYAGYYPAGLSLDRIFEQLPGVPFRDHVWPKFLRENAARLFDLP